MAVEKTHKNSHGLPPGYNYNPDGSVSSKPTPKQVDSLISGKFQELEPQHLPGQDDVLQKRKRRVVKTSYGFKIVPGE